MDSTTVDHALVPHRLGDLEKAESLYRKILAREPGHVDALHLLGMVRHARGDHQQAERLIRQAIAIQPALAVLHSNLGIVLAAGGDAAAAIAEYRTAVPLDPQSAENLNNLGVALHAAGECGEAIGCFKQAVILRPSYADARNNLLLLLNLKPSTAAACHALGDLLHEADRQTDAIEFYRQAIELDPGSAQTCNNLGNALFAGGPAADALLQYRRALELQPQFPQALNNLANALKELGQLEEAIAAYRQAVELQPENPAPLSNLGNALRDAGQWQSAMDCYQQALAIQPDHAITHNNIGNAWCEIGEWVKAMRSYETALVTEPDYADAINNLGTALEEVGQRERAMQCYCRAKELGPKLVSPPWNIALLQLLTGDYTNGWPGYENRWRQKKQCRTRRDFAQPMLTRLSQIKGSRILLHAEQGFGDTIQFCRYAPLVAQAGAEVFLECSPNLVRILSSLQGITSVIPRGSPLPNFDLHCPLMSLPMVFNTNATQIKKGTGTFFSFPDRQHAAKISIKRGGLIAGDEPECVPKIESSSVVETEILAGLSDVCAGLRLSYSEFSELEEKKKGSGTFNFSDWIEKGTGTFYLSADSADVARWRDRFAGEPAGVRVGLVWAGQGTHQKDRQRSLPLAAFALLGGIPGVRYYSLQVGDAARQTTAPPPGLSLIDWTGDLQDFADTAALMSQLDLVITVDTAVCHLAGAIGKPVWVLLAFQPDWRWLLDREDSPWYPSARLFRQRTPGDWEECLQRVARELARVDGAGIVRAPRLPGC